MTVREIAEFRLREETASMLFADDEGERAECMALDAFCDPNK